MSLSNICFIPFSITIPQNPILSHVKIEQTIKFPLEGLPADTLRYLEPGEFIDFNGDIRKKASEIIEGETDLYEAMEQVVIHGG